MSKIRRFQVIAPLAALLWFALGVSVALAHPLGNFTINHYARLEFAPAQLRARYLFDLAEIPTF